MNSKDKSKKDIDLESIMQEALEFKSEEEKTELDEELLHLNFMHIIEGIIKDKKMHKKDLAEQLKISPSFVTQLFTAEKIININTLAKVQRLFNITFNIDYTSHDAKLSESFVKPEIPFLKVVHCSKYLKPKGDKDYDLQYEVLEIGNKQM